jgi:hypothetical protein
MCQALKKTVAICPGNCIQPTHRDCASSPAAKLCIGCSIQILGTVDALHHLCQALPVLIIKKKLCHRNALDQRL